MTGSMLADDPIAASTTPVTPLRICLVTEASGGGVGRHFLDLAHGLAAQGVDVTGIYSAHRSDALFKRGLAASTGVRLVKMSMRRAIHPQDSLDLWRLVKLLRQLGPFDVIHGQSSKGGALARLAARWVGIPSVYTPNALVTLDPALPSWKRTLYGSIERWLARHSSALIAVSMDEALHARSLGIEAKKIHTIFNGIERPQFPPRNAVRIRLGLAPEDVVVGFVGRLSAQKAPELLLEAFAKVQLLQPTTRLVVVGSGPLEADVRRRIEALGLASAVILLGDVVATEVMPAFDMLCLCSRYEGFPYVLLEALAAGLPIVATEVGGVSECVEPEVNGLVVSRDDPPSLASAMVRMSQDASLRRRFAAASAQRASRFPAQRTFEQTLAVYQQVLAQRVLQ
jgi:glycosyltransferase involved in cell wall biosynthesis